MNITFSGTVFFWRGPAPFFFVRVPAKEADDIRDVSRFVTYGWGMIPVTVEVGQTRWETSLFPKDGSYLVPLKDRVRTAERLAEGSTVTVRIEVRRRKP